MPVHKGIKVAAVNRKARHDYFIEDTLECGIALTGTEVKSIRKGALNLKDSYALVKKGELLLQGMHISPYEPVSYTHLEPEQVQYPESNGKPIPNFSPEEGDVVRVSDLVEGEEETIDTDELIDKITAMDGHPLDDRE